MILQYMSELVESDDSGEKIRLKDELAGLINLAKLDLEEEKATHTKKLIIATIESYAKANDPSLRQALIEHTATLNKLLFNYC